MPKRKGDKNESKNANGGGYEKTTTFFIPPTSDVPEEILNHYDISKSGVKRNRNSGSPGHNNYKSQLKALAEDYFERLDSRGKMIKIRRVHAVSEMLGPNSYETPHDILGYPYSTFNLHQLSYIT